MVGCVVLGLLPSHAASSRAVPAAAREVLPDSSSLLGSYLAGRLARGMRDSDSAAFYYQQALLRDPGNEDILENAFELELASGDFATARTLAQRLVRRQKDNKVAHIFLGLDAFKRGDFDGAQAQLLLAGDSAPAPGVQTVPIAKGAAKPRKLANVSDPAIKLSLAWTLAAQGQFDKALASLETPGQVPWAAHFEAVQRAFIADVARKKAAGDDAYRAVYDKKPGNARVAEAFARHLAVWGDPAQAEAVLTESEAAGAPMGKALLAEIKSGKTPKLMVSTPEEGLAEVYLGIGQVVATSNGVDAAQTYLRLALFLNPKSDIAQLELAELHDALGQYGKAIQVFEKIQVSSPFWLNAQIRKAVSANALERHDEAVALLKGLLDKYPAELQIPETIASIESARKNFGAAIPFYDKALALSAPIEKKHWVLYYARGIAYERTKQWNNAEADFKKAMELDPEQSAVLNYLGYSWIDQQININEAFDLIVKAVSLRPNDGFIVDSLGWAYYIQKNYGEALKNLERAVELRPEDPTLNEHLGDIYWRLNRKLEAKFQWYQALSLKPEPEDAVKIQKKVDLGLPDDGGPRAELAPASRGAPEPQGAAPDLSRGDGTGDGGQSKPADGTPAAPPAPAESPTGRAP